MAKQIEEISTVWRALSSSEPNLSGWHVSPITSIGSLQLLGGRFYPTNTESLLIRMSDKINLNKSDLPNARGFEVTFADPYKNQEKWLAISRTENGNERLYSDMIRDVLSMLIQEKTRTSVELTQSLIAHIRMWQAFMSRGDSRLSPEKEIGLIGELFFLHSLLTDYNFPQLDSIVGWLGPEDGPQDFVLSSGSIEVKSTASSDGHIIKISSINQLDDSFNAPIHICFQRVSQSKNGRSLPQLIDDISSLIIDPNIKDMLMFKLLCAGYHSLHRTKYENNYSLVGRSFFKIESDFPSLTRSSVDPAITALKYEMDLSLLQRFIVPDPFIQNTKEIRDECK